MDLHVVGIPAGRARLWDDGWLWGVGCQPRGLAQGHPVSAGLVDSGKPSLWFLIPTGLHRNTHYTEDPEIIPVPRIVVIGVLCMRRGGNRWIHYTVVYDVGKHVLEMLAVMCFVSKPLLLTRLCLYHVYQMHTS